MDEFNSKELVNDVIVTQSELDAGGAELVYAVVKHVNKALDEGQAIEAITDNAKQSYYADLYLAQVNNGGHGQFYINTRKYENYGDMKGYIAAGLRAMKAKAYVSIFDNFLKWENDNPDWKNREIKVENTPESMDAIGKIFDELKSEMGGIDEIFFNENNMSELNANWIRTWSNLKVLQKDSDKLIAGTTDFKAKPASNPENNSWVAPHEKDGFNITEERAPWGRWIVGLIALALVLGGAIWLASQVVVPKDLPVTEKAQIEPEEKAPKIGADAAAWVKALEKDTLEGYREYLAAFPKGKHADDAQAEIDAYDNKAWATAEQRNTLAGYEDYLEAWPEGLHASKARERIAQIKAEAEARAKDAAERAALDKTHWEAAARENTIESYSRYLTQHPTGQYVAEAQTRIEQIKADQASAAAKAADTAAWEAAKTANRVDSYQQYMTSYPQGAYVPQALAAIEQLRPAPGRTFRDCSGCPEMVSLPSGTASLGAGENEKDARPNEKPQRPVTFADMFAIGVKEVTFAEYMACVSDGGCTGQPRDNGWGKGNRPVINVSWDQAQKYTSWLSQKSGKSYALPTEAQWEYAARAGDSNPVVGGSLAALCAFANGASQESGFKWANAACTDPAVDRTLPTGMLGANKFGVKDMIGNVAEWTQDCNTLNLRDAPTDGAADSRGSCNQRVVRGGSWFSGPADLRYAARLMQRRGDSNDFTGFRVVRKTGP